MSICNKLFLEFNLKITPSDAEMNIMKISRKALEKKISLKLYERLGVSVNYYTQGSRAHKMQTIIIKENGTYDIDRGVYLPSKPFVNAETVQRYVLEAINDHTVDGAEHRKKCIRIYYKGAYNIDFTVYYKEEEESYSYLASMGDGWVKDDPRKMIDWLSAFKDEEGQLLRVIKYLKAWSSKCSDKMPSGIALAIWAAKYFEYVPNRDDKSLINILKQIQTSICFSVSCISPVEPYDDFTAKLNTDQKQNFKSELENFIFDAQKAIDEPNQLLSSKLWIKYFGTRFPLGIDEDIDKRAKALFAVAEIVSSQKPKLSSSGQINNVQGVIHQTHRNYGS